MNVAGVEVTNAEPKEGDRLRLIIGTGFGYHAAVLSAACSIGEAQEEAMRIGREGHWDGMNFYPPQRISSVTVAKADIAAASKGDE